MGLLQQLAEKFTKKASESGELKKVRLESERRRAAKSSALNPKVEDDDAKVDGIINALSHRIRSKEKTGE